MFSLNKVQRRQFLGKILNGFIYSLAGLGLAYPIFSFITFRKSMTRTVSFGPKEQLSPVNVKDGAFLIKKEIETYALSARCSHLGCTLNYDPVSLQFRCPCHGSKFDFSGKWISGPAKKNLQKIPITKTNNKDIIVTLKL